MKAHIFVLLGSLVAASFGQSPGSGTRPLQPAPMRSLADAQIFALGPVGYAGRTSQEEIQFKAIFLLDQRRAEQELERLYSSGNPQAMSYALVGMRRLDPKRYVDMLSASLVSDANVTTMRGCIMEGEKLRTVASKLDSGRYDPLLRWLASLKIVPGPGSR